MEYIEVEPKKPDVIALSFSGGGFRAASYALGCLSYLETVRPGGRSLLSLVNFVSSASGGTITNLTYSLSQHQDQPFHQYYLQLKQGLESTGLLTRVFEILENDDDWKDRPYKTRNIINAFAIAYDKYLFNGANFGAIFQKREGAIAEICANATEFDNGMQFRFQNTGIRGNKFLSFKTDNVITQLKLADILAASSCLTVGFEPIVYPEDFFYTGLDLKKMQEDIHQDTRFSPERDEKDEKQLPRFNLMDGGIDDNQGIAAFMLAEDRMQRANGFGYDLYISCDVSSNYTSGYEFPKENKKSIFLKPTLLFYISFVFLLFIASIVSFSLNFLPVISCIVMGASGLIVLLCLYIRINISKAYRKARRNADTWGTTTIPYLGKFLRMKLSVVWQMISSRATSAAYLAGVAFLKKIRRMSYDRLFEKVIETKIPNGIRVKHWKRFALQNALYLLSTKNNPQRKDDLRKEEYLTPEIEKLMQPSAALQQVVNIATNMDTTLWFDKHHDDKRSLESLLAAGGATTCYNLLRWAQRFDQQDSYWKEMVSKLAADWSAFNEKPYWLYDQYQNSNA